MRNLRIIYDNAADRADLSASPTVSVALGSANLKTDDKFRVCRSSTTSMVVKAAWPSLEQIGGVVFPYSNMSPTGTMRVYGTTETAATNLLVYSSQFDNASWVNSNTTIGLNATTAPDGTLTADRLIDTATTADHTMTQSVAVTPGAYTFSMFVKTDTRKRIRVAFPAAQFSANERATFDATTVTVANSTGGSPTITSIGNGWCRIKLTGTCTTAGTAVITVYNMTDAGTSTTSYSSSTANSIFIWGAQLETGTTMTSYFPTVTTAMTRPTGYMDDWQAYNYNSGLIVAAPAPAPRIRGWTAAAAASAYGFGGGSCPHFWLTTKQAFTGLRIELADASNLQGYLEVSRLVVGDYWEPSQGVENGATVTTIDNSKHFRTEAGNLLTDVGTKHKKQSLPLPWLDALDRVYLWDIITGNGMSAPVFLSVYPTTTDYVLERMHMMYGKLVTSPIMSTPYFDVNSATLEFEEV